MNAEKLIKDTVEESFIKVMRETLNIISEKVIEKLSNNTSSCKYNTNDFLTEQQVADFLSLPLGTLRTWRYQKIYLPYSILAKKIVRYQFKDVLEFAIKRKIAVIKESLIIE